ncbi:hypothetical protein CROQUDRAFT_89793 [Cronartium quercuum f. sp. fusiforme G11]|uniref:Uncharacterized protein n=1 Tax=Cronartium quercuum f. sp. fusiforme G11 TaxID=708437 RepID=A0A9P6TDW0_9BASI|nr:hypothetical protein CROQUDRAFT_89793 [Cronartium quercuum f. sp. fusiforme G11]
MANQLILTPAKSAHPRSKGSISHNARERLDLSVFTRRLNVPPLNQNQNETSSVFCWIELQSHILRQSLDVLQAGHRGRQVTIALEISVLNSSSRMNAETPFQPTDDKDASSNQQNTNRHQASRIPTQVIHSNLASEKLPLEHEFRKFRRMAIGLRSVPYDEVLKNKGSLRIPSPAVVNLPNSDFLPDKALETHLRLFTRLRSPDIYNSSASYHTRNSSSTRANLVHILRHKKCNQPKTRPPSNIYKARKAKS